MRSILLAAIALSGGLAAPAAGQDAQGPGAIATTTPAVDLSRLPVNVGRIGRQLKQTEVREERDGLRLRYNIQVYGELPRIQFITPLDNILTGDVSRSAPTHGDMIRMMTPQEFSAPVIGLGSVPRRK